MGDGKIHVYFIFLRPFLFEISQRRKEEPKHVFRETVPEKGRMDGYTQGISQSTWGGWGPGLSSELLSCFTHWITLVQWVKFALWWSYSSSARPVARLTAAAWRGPHPSPGPGVACVGKWAAELLRPLWPVLTLQRLRLPTVWGHGIFQNVKKNTVSHLLRQTCTRVCT